MRYFIEGFIKEAFPKQKAIFLDLDDTVRTTVGGKKCPNHPSEQRIMPGRKEKLTELKKAGYKLIAITNQGGIGAGYMTESQCKECLVDLDKQLGGVFDKMYYAKAHPKENHPWTKPNPGMLQEASREFNLDLKKSIMVGDRDTDKGAAENAGTQFRWAKDFFGDKL